VTTLRRPNPMDDGPYFVGTQPHGGGPRVSVILPVKNRGILVVRAVQTLLDQTYRNYEVIVVGDEKDTTWEALEHIQDPRLVRIGVDAPVKRRDANYKRNIGALNASGKILAFTDSDGTVPQTWLHAGVAQLLRERALDSRVQCVAGLIDSIGEGFWSRYVDTNIFGAKLPRIQEDYRTTAETFGLNGKKPPASGNLFVTRAAYMAVGGFDETQSRYEDYSFAWRLCRKGFQIVHVRNPEMVVAHRHRAGLKLFKEYKAAGNGCRQFIERAPDCPLSELRTNQLRQWQGMLGIAALLVILTPIWPLPFLFATVLALVGLFGLGIVETVKLRKFEAIVYPTLTLILGSVFTYGIASYKDLREPDINLIARTREFA
jgi:cellulose synthase/poly-beta-1,6-N-acetylglucosamine synthase-like glycosyltransferase